MIQRGLTTPAVVPPATRNWAGRSRSRRPVKVLVPEAAAAAGDHLSARSTLYSRISALLLYGQDNSARSQGTLSYGACPTMRTGFDTAPIAESTAGRGLGLTLGPIAMKGAAKQRRDHANQNHARGSARITFMAEDQLVARLV